MIIGKPQVYGKHERPGKLKEFENCQNLKENSVDRKFQFLQINMENSEKIKNLLKFELTLTYLKSVENETKIVT